MNARSFVQIHQRASRSIFSDRLPHRNVDRLRGRPQRIRHGFLAIDADHAGKRPGVLVVHGGAGLDEHARRRARLFAESGFVVFACDMYGEGVTGNRERTMHQIGALRNNRTTLVRRVQPAIEILLSRPEVDGRIAAVGYCFGGMIALEYARSGSAISGVVSVHG